MDRILRGVQPSVTLYLYDSSGDLLDAGGTVTAAIVNSAGTSIQSGITATSPSDGIYTIVPNPISVLDIYKVTWTLPDATTRITYFEVVGGFYFAIADLRALDAELVDEGVYPPAILAQARAAAEDTFEAERNGGVAHVRRGRRVYLDGSGSSRLMLPDVAIRSVISGTLDGVAFSGADITDMAVYDAWVDRKTAGFFTTGQQNVQLLYEHGHDQPSARVQRAALILARHYAVTTVLSLNDRATAQFSSDGTGFRLTIAGRDGPTGLPDVDSVMRSEGRLQAGAFA